MTIDEFWELIDEAHRRSKQCGGDPRDKAEWLVAELRKLPAKDGRDFDSHFQALYHRAYHWPLWAAAYIIQGGCSDDGFMDFREALISLGRTRYESALADPESLADLDEEDYQALHVFTWGSFIGEAVDVPLNAPQPPHPKEPTGTNWDEKKVREMYPRLAARFQ